MAYNTGNPVPSTDAKDFIDNCENIDKFVNSFESTATDRNGVTRSTWEGIAQGLSFFNVGTFAVGFTLTNSRQTLTYDGHEYGWSGDFPKVVNAGSTPTPLGSGGWIDRSDITLRVELSSQGGAALSLSILATAYGVSFNDGTIWSNGATLNHGEWAYFEDKLWTPNGASALCGATPYYADFHTLNPSGILTPENFGAVDGQDATAAINRLCVYLTAYSLGIVQLDKEYLVSPSTHAGLPGTFGANSVCINALNNLQLIGGKLKLRDGTGGASGAVIGNWSGNPISNCVVSTSIDGNKANATGTMSGVVLVNATNCHWDGTGRTIENLSFNGVQFALSSVGCSAVGGTYRNINYIGLQAQRADGFQALYGHFYNITDNAIDLEANNSNADQNIVGYNVINGCNTGVFIESGDNTQIIGNAIEVFTDSGIIFNQINTDSINNIVTANTIKRGAGVGVNGIKFVNNCGYSYVYGNHFIGLDYSLVFDFGTHVLVGTNTHQSIQKQLIKITRAANALVYSVIEKQYLQTPRATGSTGYPFTCSPTGNANNFSNRISSSTINPAYNMEQGPVASADAEYVRGTYSTSINGGWGAYAIFTSGYTLVNIPGISAGDYVLINGTLFLLYAFVGGGWQIRNLAGADGNYTPTVNGSYPVTEYYPAWQTD